MNVQCSLINEFMFYDFELGHNSGIYVLRVRAGP